MGLTLSVLRCPDAVPPETRQVEGGEFSIGRGADNDWILPDPDRTLSRQHCVVAFRSGGWQVADTSTNGTFLNREAEPLGQEAPRDLRDGDRLRLGAYEVEVRISAEAAWQGGDQVSDPFGDDPFGQARPTTQGLGGDPLLAGGGGFGTPSVTLPEDYDPMTPEPGDGGFRGPTQADHASALEQSFRVPAAPERINFDEWDLDLGKAAGTSQPTNAAAPTPPAPTKIDALDDWDIDLSPAAPTAAAPPPPPPMAPAPAVDVSEDPFAEPGRDAAIPAPAAVAIPRPTGPRPTGPPPLATAPAASAPPTPARAADGADLLAAFLRGAGMEDARPADPAMAMEHLGAAFRAMVAGLRQALIARATIKGEFRIEQTMIRARGNNPLKFSAGDDDALAALLGAGRRTDMTPQAAVSEALEDIRLHELASMAAMQTAVRALIDRFDPAPLRAEGDKSGGMLAAQKRARAFELFEKLHGDITAALADDFDSVFGKAFARAYEQALREVSDRGRG